MIIELQLSDSEVDRIAKAVVKAMQDQAESDRMHGERILYTEKEVAEMLGVSAFSLKRWREEGRIAAHRNKRPILYNRDQIDKITAWLANQ